MSPLESMPDFDDVDAFAADFRALVDVYVSGEDQLDAVATRLALVWKRWLERVPAATPGATRQFVTAWRGVGALSSDKAPSSHDERLVRELLAAAESKLAALL
jgi:hypothetical protein